MPKELKLDFLILEYSLFQIPQIMKFKHLVKLIAQFFDEENYLICFKQ